MGYGIVKKKKVMLLLSAFAGACIGVGTYKANKKKKKTAVEGEHVPNGPYEAVIKRLVDAILSGAALIVLSPMLLITALLVRIKLGSPVMFCQERPGKDEEIFKLYKFRTMTDEKDDKGELLPDEMRLTPFGKFLRSTSLDELPELWNIVKGDMSIVGPRPLLKEYIPYYSKKQHRRHDVRPGLTGYAQVHGRNALNWEEKFELDVQYVNHISFLGDMKIILETIFKVLKREGISSATSATMESFVSYVENKGNT